MLATVLLGAVLLTGLVGAAAASQSSQPGPPEGAEAECQPVALLEAPVAGVSLRGVVTVGGWAIDLLSPAGTGVSDVHVYLDGYGAEPGHTFIGRAQYGGARADVAELFNDVRFARSAFNLSWDASTAGAGSHTLVVLYRTRCGWTSLTQTFDIEGPTTLLNVETPRQGSLVNGPVRVQGWAADPQASTGTGVERIELYVDGQITTRGVPVGEVPYGETRPDVGAALGGDSEGARARFSRSGFATFWNPAGLSAGVHNLTFYARGADGAVARSLTIEVSPAAAAARPTSTVGVAGTPGRITEGFPLTIANTQPTSVALAWGAVAGAASYDVYAAESASAFFPTQTGLPDTRLTVGGLAPARSYRFYVRAFDRAGQEVAQSNTVTVTTGALVVTPTVLPTITPRPSPTIPNQF
jgi:hypothetical protein